MVEQLTRNEQVVSSSLILGSIYFKLPGEMQVVLATNHHPVVKPGALKRSYHIMSKRVYCREMLSGAKPELTNYANPQNWLALPFNAPHQVDVFFLNATGYVPSSQSAPLVGEATDPGMRDKGAYQIKAKASVFAPFANIFAPFYRQLDARALVGLSAAQAYELLDLPKRDVFAALDAYFAYHNCGRPFILAGHSQGSALLTLVLSEYMREREDLWQRLIAAYVLGYSVTEEWLAQNPRARFATGPDDVGVIISWNVEAPGNIGHDNVVVRQGARSINPLTWRLDAERAGADMNKGCFFARGKEAKKGIQKGFADAQLDLQRGVVICRTADPEQWAHPDKNMFGPQSFHSWDYGFYYMNLRENCAERVRRWFALHS